MILHIVHDEKFIDLAYRIFEEAHPQNNEYVILTKPSNLRYIKNTPIKFFEKNNFPELYRTLDKYEMVIIHCLTDIKIKFIAGIDKPVKLVWIGWGGDYYDLITGDVTKTYKTKTFDLYTKNRLGFFQVFFRNSRKSFARLFKGVKDKRDILSKFSFFAPVMQEEYFLMKKNLDSFNCKFLAWNYGTLEDDFIRGFESVTVDGDNILLGNSATYSNNHLDVMEILSQKDLKNAKLICPLSYGNMEYRKDILSSGNALFGESFNPLISFMPIKDYTSLIASCSVVIMGHLIQQGLGNIITMLHLGAKVFLDVQNPVYTFFKEQGAFIYSLEELDQERGIRLTQAQIEFNRSVLSKHWNREVIINKTRSLIKIVNESGVVA